MCPPKYVFFCQLPFCQHQNRIPNHLLMSCTIGYLKWTSTRLTLFTKLQSNLFSQQTVQTFPSAILRHRRK